MNTINDFRLIGFARAIALMPGTDEQKTKAASAYKPQHATRVTKFTKIASIILNPDAK